VSCAGECECGSLPGLAVVEEFAECE